MSSQSKHPGKCRKQPSAGNRTGGKTRDSASTREAILQAAQLRFLRDGYDQAGLRAIAGDAGIDPALICRYFGSKEKLFAEVLANTSRDPMEILSGDRASFGARVARAMLDPSRETSGRGAFFGLVTRSSASPVASKLVLRHIEEQFVTPFAAWLGDERATEKAWLMVSVLMGVAIVNDLDPSHSAQYESLARLLQSIIDQP